MRQGNSPGSSWLFASPYGREPTDAVRLVGTITAILSIGAGVIHISAAGDHTNLPVMFVGFIVVAALQVALGGLLALRRPSKLLVAAGVALMAGSIGVWLLSRTEGLAFLGGEHAEPIGFKDGVCVLFELASIPPLLLLFSSDLARVSLPSARLASRTLAVAGAGCFALLVPALLLGGGEHHTHAEAVALGIHEHDEGHEHSAGDLAAQADGHDHGDSVDLADTHQHSGSAHSAAGHQHLGTELASTLGVTHQHSTAVTHTHTDTTDHTGHEHSGHKHHRNHRDGNTHHGHDHGDAGHGGHGDHGDDTGEPGSDQPISVSYEPDPSVCVADICVP